MNHPGYSRRVYLVLLAGAGLLAAPIVEGQQRVVPDSATAKYVGQTVTVEGTVANVHLTRSGTTFLNFGSPYPNQTFTAVIFRSEASRFSNPQQWEGKHVRVRGQVRLYRGKPEIVLDDPAQLAAAP